MSEVLTNHQSTVIDSYWFDKNKFIANIPQPCHIAIDTYSLSDVLPNIFIQVEPNIIVNNEQYIIDNHQKYHTIFTFNKNILEKCSNSKKYIYGTTWINKNDYENIDITQKHFKISTLTGSKLIHNASGHIFRQTIHHNQMALQQYPITFFRSYAQQPHIHDYGNNPFIGTQLEDKIELFKEFQFSIVIENSRQINYFTEKLMDCLITKTIPIYWGCPNITEFFDTTGWIILETISIDEIINKLNILNDEYYDNYKNIINKNYNETLKYIDIYTNINNAQ